MFTRVFYACVSEDDIISSPKQSNCFYKKKTKHTITNIYSCILNFIKITPFYCKNKLFLQIMDEPSDTYMWKKTKHTDTNIYA